MPTNFIARLSLKLQNKNSNPLGTSSETATATATASGSKLSDAMTSAFNIMMLDPFFNNPDTANNNTVLTIQSNENPAFETVIPNIPAAPFIIFDNNQNLYITSDGSPNQLLKYNSQYELQEFVSDSAWLFGPNNNLPTLPVAMAFDNGFEHMYVTNFANNTITVIDMNNKYSYTTLTLTPENGGQGKGYRLSQPNGLTFNSTGTYMIATNILDSNLVKIVFKETSNGIDPYSGIISPFNPSVPLTQPILVTNDNQDNFYVSNFSIDPQQIDESIIYKVTSDSYSIVAQYPDVYEPRGVSFNTNDYSQLWITNSSPSNNNSSTSSYPIISVDVNTLDVTNVINSELFNNPRGVIFSSANYMYVSNFGSSSVNGSILQSEQQVVL
jgi:hypothetical protein